MLVDCMFYKAVGEKCGTACIAGDVWYEKRAFAATFYAHWF